MPAAEDAGDIVCLYAQPGSVAVSALPYALAGDGEGY